jgi:hypothetical protein
MRDTTPQQADWRRKVVERIFVRTSRKIFARSGDRFGHQQGPWSPFDNTGSFQDVFQSVTQIGTRLLAVQDEPVLAAAHIDNVRIAACALALRGLHSGRTSFSETIAHARAGAEELESQRRGVFARAFDLVDVRMVYEAVAGQAPRLGPDKVLRPSIGSPNDDIFPGGVRFELAQRLLADATASWPARPDGLRWALMWFLQTEIAERRTQPMRGIGDLDNAWVERDRVLRFLSAFDNLLNTQQYFLPVSREMFRAGRRRNRTMCSELAHVFESALARGQSPGQALHRMVVEAERLPGGGTRPHQ